GHRISHRRRPASGFALPILSRPELWPEATLSPGTFESLHHGGSSLPGQAGQADHPGNAGTIESGWSRLAAWRGRGNFRRSRAPHHLRSQDRWRGLARDRAVGAPDWPEIECHHAVWTRGERRGPRRPPAEIARAAG